jgi:acetoin utilization deacetylase AcuC-like enzyme
MAERTAGGRLALVLEGGYDLRALADGVREVLKAMAGEAGPSGGGPRPAQPTPPLRVELEEALVTFRGRWDIPVP